VPTPLRSIRIPDDVWHVAVERAKVEGTSVSAWVVADLRKRLKRHAPTR
jgi:hypothetical protein